MNPTSIIFVGLIYLFSASKYAHCGPQEQSYKTQLTTLVLPPYNQAYKTLQNRVLNDLLAVNVAALNEDTVDLLANRLLCASRDTYEGLQQAASATNQVKTQVEQPVVSSLAQIATYENDIATKESEIRETDTAIQSTQALLAAAELIANGKKQILDAADAAVRAAEADVEKAKKCRSKRGWLSSIFPSIAGSSNNAIKDTAVNPECPVNYDILENAKNIRREAGDDFTNASHQAADYRKEVAYLQAHKRNLDAQVKTSKGALAALRGDLKSFQGDLSSIANIDTELKKIETGLSSVFTGPATLHDVLAKLVDFDQLIGPLNAIYKSVQQYTTVDPSAHVSIAQTKQANINLAQLQSAFSTVSYNPNLNLVCSK